MKLHSLVVIPLAFVAGIVAIVALQKTDVIQIGTLAGNNNSAQANQSQKQAAEQNAAPVVAQTTAAPEGMSNAQLSERIDTLQQQLRESTLNADGLQVRVDDLEEKLNGALGGSSFLPSGEPAGDASEITSNENGAEQGRGNRRGGFGGPSSDQQYEDLVAAGVDPLVAQEIKRQEDQWTLQRLELVDQATREGWRRSDEFQERIQELQEQRPSIRDELGDQSYDEYLYSSGDFNRVEVSSIIEGSAAQLAGMQNGDVVMSYADSRVFSMRELQNSTREGSRGESVQVQVLRDGQVISVDLPRGPLGVTLSGSRSEPES